MIILEVQKQLYKEWCFIMPLASKPEEMASKSPQDVKVGEEKPILSWVIPSAFYRHIFQQTAEKTFKLSPNTSRKLLTF